MNRCLITGRPGNRTRRFTADELVGLYASYLRHALPTPLARKYFTQPIDEYTCATSGLRWYSPAATGESDFYEFLGQTFDWYYRTTRWDKDLALQILPRLGVRRMVEVGCGDGTFLERVRSLGIATAGVEINSEAIARAQGVGLDVRRPEAFRTQPNEPVDAVVMLQVLEHVPAPVEFVREYLDLFRPRHVVLSMPCYESLLGLSRDPLSWPPHHVTAWSPTAIESLATRLGLSVDQISLEPVTIAALCEFSAREPDYRLPGTAGVIARLAHRRWGRAAAAAWLATLRLVPRHWARCSHSLIAVLRAP